MRGRSWIGIAALAVLVVVSPAAAASSEAWEHGVAVYLWGAGLSGDSTVHGVDADVDLSFSEILENLEAAGMLAYRGKGGTWAVMSNAVFVGLGATEDLPLGGAADADVDMAILEVDGAYEITKGFELLFGLRGVWMDLAVELRSPVLPTSDADQSKSWIDPLIGARFEVPMGKKWAFVGRGDIGGFGVGSDLAWQATAHFDWHISPHVGMAFGYELLGMDYNDGSRADEFRYDMTMQGPFLAVTFAF